MRPDRKKRKINYKRFIISLTVLAIVLLPTVKISKKIFAKDYSDNLKSEVEEVHLDKNQDKDTNSYHEENIPIHNKEDEANKAKDLEDIKNVDEVKEEKPEQENHEKDKTNKPNDYKDIFKNSVFLGDSITDSLSFYKFLEKSNVVAKFGLTAKKAVDEIPNIVNKDPKSIFIMFGMNDMIINDDSQKFKNDYLELIQAIREQLPNAKIYINSILPVDSKAKNKKSALTNENIDKFNEVLKKLSKDENIEYLNIASIFDDNTDLFEPDGIHIKYKFYKLWLDFIIERIDNDE